MDKKILGQLQDLEADLGACAEDAYRHRCDAPSDLLKQYYAGKEFAFSDARHKLLKVIRKLIVPGS